MSILKLDDWVKMGRVSEYEYINALKMTDFRHESFRDVSSIELEFDDEPKGFIIINYY